MRLFPSQLRKLPSHAALLMALSGASVATQAQTTSIDGTGSSSTEPTSASSGAPMGSPMGAPLGTTAEGAQPIEPLQRPVDASRKTVGGAAGPELATPATQPGPTGKATALAEGPQPLNSAASVGADYRIGPNDLIEFDVFGVPDMKRTVRVNATGVVSLPLIGAVALAGLTSGQAEALVAQRYQADFLQNPQVSLFIKEFTSQRITIEGAVARPGIYPVTGELTLLRALALAGGGAQYAMLTEVMLFRSGSSLANNTEVFDLEKIRNGEVPDPAINADDVIVVKRDPKRTALRDSFFGDLLSTLNPFK